jgi:hypothetical protein
MIKNRAHFLFASPREHGKENEPISQQKFNFSVILKFATSPCPSLAQM